MIASRDSHYTIMSKDQTLELGYAAPWIGHGYDALSWLIYRPIGGRDRLRDDALDAVGVQRGQRVLELGCGTGGLTQKLIARGARVTAVDWSEPMLHSARRRAPTATFVRSEITECEVSRDFDLVLFAFVLHELAPDARALALNVAKQALAPHGKVAIVDHAEPREGLVPRAIFRCMCAFEPESMLAWARAAQNRFEPELQQAGLRPTRVTPLARGTAQAVVAHA
jgi:ubiquinone/menaquinone biosynthesis C-methylase UbiE